MRKDMFKVIVERPRRGGKWQKGKDRREKNTALEDLPSRQSMRRRYFDRKELNENLKPLQRYFRSQVGRPWDKVFSEVCEHLNVNSTVQQHVKDHIKDLVHLHVERAADGKILDQRYNWGGEFHEIYHGDLYVDPKTKILRRYKSDHHRRRWRMATPEDVLKEALAKLDLVLHEGVLYKAERRKVRSPKYDAKQVSMVKANGTHAANDANTLSSNLREFFRHLTRKLYHDHEYFQVADKILTERDERAAREKAALERKKLEALANLATKV